MEIMIPTYSRRCDMCGREASRENAEASGWITVSNPPTEKGCDKHFCPTCKLYLVEEEKKRLAGKTRDEAAHANISKLRDAVFAFSKRMEKRLEQKADAGYTGWDNENSYSTRVCLNDLVADAEALEHTLSSQLGGEEYHRRKMKLAVDIANRAMFVWFRANEQVQAEPGGKAFQGVDFGAEPSFTAKVQVERCGDRGFATMEGNEGCVLPKGHAGAHEYAGGGKPSVKVDLHATTDAQVWAQEFMKVVQRFPSGECFNEGFMLGWFANAIETGRAAGEREFIEHLKQYVAKRS